MCESRLAQAVGGFWVASVKHAMLILLALWPPLSEAQVHFTKRGRGASRRKAAATDAHPCRDNS